MRTTSQLIARRIGRIVFGGVLLAGVVRLIVAAYAGELGRASIYTGRGLDAARTIELTWLTAVIAGVAAWRVAARVRFDLDPEKLFAESLMVPAVGIALLLPITLHMPVILVIRDSAAFDVWVVASMWITGLAHAVFAITSALRGKQLVTGTAAWSPRKIYIATVVTSCVPFAVLYAIPPAIVAITALPFVPLLRAMEWIVVRERKELVATQRALPRAIAMVSRPPRPPRERVTA
jgi:hypothetical protein